MVSKQDNAQVLKYTRARVWRDTFKSNHEKDVKYIKLEAKMAVIKIYIKMPVNAIILKINFKNALCLRRLQKCLEGKL